MEAEEERRVCRHSSGVSKDSIMFGLNRLAFVQAHNFLLSDFSLSSDSSPAVY